MDVVALAQHGVDYAVATLGTATTPVHVQKLFRLTDPVVFCFDGDNAGRKAAWRALENTLPVLADGKNAPFLFLPDGEDPDDYVRKRGKAAFEALIAGAMPLSEFLLPSSRRRHPPDHRRGPRRAGRRRQAAARPAWRTGPRRAAAPRLADLTGLPETDLRGLLPAAGSERPAPAATNPRRRRRRRLRPRLRRVRRRGPGASRGGSSRRPGGPARRAPSLVRDLIQALLLKPEACRRHRRRHASTTTRRPPPRWLRWSPSAPHHPARPRRRSSSISPARRMSERSLTALARCEDHGLTADQADCDRRRRAGAVCRKRNEAAEVRQLLATAARPADRRADATACAASRRVPAKDPPGAAG